MADFLYTLITLFGKTEGEEMIRYQKNRLVLGNDGEELIKNESGGMPFVCNYNEGCLFIGHHIPWHWHDWFEINYTEKGSFLLQTSERTMEIHQGEAVFINSSLMHAYDFPKEVDYYSLSCDTHFPGGEPGGYLDRKYFSPVFRSKSLSVLHIKPDTERRVRMIHCIVEFLRVMREEPGGYELAVRESLVRFLLLLSEEAAEILAKERAGNYRDQERMKLMLNYIYNNYEDQIGVPEIAQAAGVSPRECARCFRRSVSLTPVRFLIEYRIQMAAVLLLRTDQSVSEIAANCGFLSDSYFNKIFREIHQCTPREYRKSFTGLAEQN